MPDSGNMSSGEELSSKAVVWGEQCHAVIYRATFKFLGFLLVSGRGAQNPSGSVWIPCLLPQ